MKGFILTLPILPCPEGWISWSIPVDGLMMTRMSVIHQNSGGIGKSSPPHSRFPLTLQISLGLRSQEISWVLGNLLAVGDGFPNTSLILVEHGYNILTQQDIAKRSKLGKSISINSLVYWFQNWQHIIYCKIFNFQFQHTFVWKSQNIFLIWKLVFWCWYTLLGLQKCPPNLKIVRRENNADSEIKQNCQSAV